MIVLGITLILAISNIIDLTLRINYKHDKKDTKSDDENNN